MNILLIRSDVEMAGPAKLMHAYAKALRCAGHDVYIASGGGEYANELEKDGFPHATIDGLRIRSRNPLLAPASILKIRKLISHKHISIINSFNAHAGLLSHLADPFRQARHFNTVLGTGKEWANRFLSNFIFPGRIIAVSNDVRERLVKAGISDDKITVIYNSTLDERFFENEPERDVKPGSVRLCGVAVFTGNKGQEFIISLLGNLVHSRGLDVYLTLVGDGPSRSRCENLAVELDISDRVNFAGALIDVIPELDNSDIFIHLPKTETFGIVLAEAMARSLPVISVNVGGIPEVVINGETGFLVESREDMDSLVNLVEQYIHEPEKRHIMGKMGHKVAFKRFSLNKLQDDLIRAYKIFDGKT